ncbi:MAG TPA: hypothetical protein VGZ25_13330 [Gemmataceae bacterium]|jgi:hypothetical protein|nr:hypothetical protein [Gemmataceae bacterium]
MNEQGRAFVEAFIAPARRERYLLHLASAKNRRKALNRLNHQFDIRAGVASEMPASLTSAGLAAELRRRGAPATCHVIADESEHDGQELPLEDGTDLVWFHTWGIVLCCVPSRLACYKAESPSPVYLLEKGPMQAETRLSPERRTVWKKTPTKPDCVRDAKRQ